MSFRGKSAVPATPRVISPSPTPSEQEAGSSQDATFGAVTRSAARKRLATPQPVLEDLDEDSLDDSPDLRRARTRSRSPIDSRRIPPLTSSKSRKAEKKVVKKAVATVPNGIPVPENGYLSPTSATGFWSWRDFSRSPSPLGLIPIHRHWRTFVHKHEVPRKVLHVSIGFFVIWLYLSGTQTRAVCPYLMGALIPIAAVDVARHNYEPFNRFYVKVLGALMRESEFAGYNGVIFYLLGAWIVLYFFPKDVGVMGTMLLSWCDTAASTFGRLYGRYTPRIRRGKSLAGSFAAFVVGVSTASWFWGWLAPSVGPMPGDDGFMFTGVLRLPHVVSEVLGLTDSQSAISGGLALGVMSLWSGFVAAASEVVDVFGWDDNFTIPVLSGLGIWGFLKVFG
ncbi:putative phosphatidate cytidylyltransferase [Phialemonium atrogriseum]|uniref:Phosphatidate cytidylyltransferase n=1 Tax=Phialemonium atrogriseum TaxID=1093897 RepID=A0AAJ0CBS6_9PEZI|nr:putative phosphatidate cytidylyltransferase [Phialemonium atrogriseum]KAK1772324.1 putative phosphatidate cytidylyltransferase [Phialemonium atrogriseum]